MTLLPHHCVMLAIDSAIDPSVWQQRGVRSVTDPQDLRGLGFSEWQSQHVPGILFPSHDPTGKVFYQFRPDHEAVFPDGSTAKYMTPERAGYCVDVHPRLLAQITEEAIPLFLTEGIKKVDCAISKGLCCLGFAGVWQFRVSKKVDPKQSPLPDWQHIVLKDRLVYIVYDSDIMRKRNVWQACKELLRFLMSRGARVRFIYLPDAENTKTGLDDYLAQGHTVKELLDLAEDNLRPFIADPITALMHSVQKSIGESAVVYPSALEPLEDLDDAGLRTIMQAVQRQKRPLDNAVKFWYGDLYRRLRLPHGQKLHFVREAVGVGTARQMRDAAVVCGAFSGERACWREVVDYGFLVHIQGTYCEMGSSNSHS